MQILLKLLALSLDIASWFYPLVLAAVAATLVATITSSLWVGSHLSMLIAASPFLYMLWLFLFICLSDIASTIIFASFKKPKRLKVNLNFNSVRDLYLFFQAERILSMYRMGTLMQRLPVLNYSLISPIVFRWMNRLAMRAYSASTHIGKNVVLTSYPQDPDLTYIGNNVVIGAECQIVAHAVNASGEALEYLSDAIEIGDDVTIGGNVRMEMGVKIGKAAVIEASSHVLPYTRIGAYEVWGGNPAEFLRMSKGYEKPEATPQDNRARHDTLVAKAIPVKPEKTVDNLHFDGLDTLIAKAIRVKPEEITDEINSDNFLDWDSLAKMAIAAAIFDRFAVRIPPAEIFQLDSRVSIKRLMIAYSEPQTQTETKPDQPKFSLPTQPELLPLHDFAEVTRSLTQKFSQPLATPDKTIHIVATFTAQSLGSTLELWCRAFGVSASANFLEFNQVEQTLLSEFSPFATNDRGLNLVLVRPEDLLTDQDPTGLERGSHIINAIQQFSSQHPGLIISNLPPAVSSFIGSSASQVDQLRIWWQSKLEQIQGIRVLDFAGLIEELGVQRCRDTSLEVMARAPYSQELYQRLGIAIARLVRQTFLPPKKVIALDCDGTLWGGVIGEDGFNGLQLSDDYPGRSFRLFQKALIDLSKSGILLVLVSKNEEADVWQVFDQHSEMQLKRTHIVSHRINWKPKSENLREIAQELNLGLDSFVFMDDSPTERLEVETNLPEVTVLPLPTQPTQYVECLTKLWCFDSLNVTEEDQQRTQYMLREQQRQNLQSSATNLESYLQSLQLEVSIRFAAEQDLSRVAQLTQKTNQFNLSLIRRSLSEIQALPPQNSILTLAVQDRFGEYGLVGVAIVKPENQQLILDSLLISCRVLGRGVEDALLAKIFDFATQQGLTEIIAPYTPGARNAQVKAFLLKMGFQSLSQDTFIAGVQNIPKCPQHVAISSQI